MIRIERHTCLLTRDNHDELITQRDEHLTALRRARLTKRYCLGVELVRGVWQLWLYEYREDGS